MDDYRNDEAKPFYKSKAWQRCRRDYAAAHAGLCERCLDKGLIVPGEIVHHKIHLDGENIRNPEITMAWSNLMLVCRKCHGELHAARRYVIDEVGRVIGIDANENIIKSDQN